MKIVDSHRHYWGKGWDPPSRIRGKADVYSISTEISEARYTRDPDGSKMIEEMDLLGTDVVVIHTVDSGLAFGEDTPTPIWEMNRVHCGFAKKYKGRVHSLFGIDPRRPGGVKLFEKAIEELGAVGLSLWPTAGFYPNDRRCYAYYQKCIDLSLPVTCHTGFQHHPMTLAKYSDPIHMDEVARDFPELTIIMCHAGMDRYPSDHWWQTAVCVAATKPNLHVDVADWQRDYTVNALADMPELFRKLRVMREQLGAQRILFGTDMPSYNLAKEKDEIRLTKQWVKLFENLPQEARKYGVTFSQEEAELMAYGNAERIFKI
jgi:hypothetical protein